MKKGGREMQETYLFLNKESPKKMGVFIRLLWASSIPKQYATISSLRGLREVPDKRISMESYLAEMKKRDLSSRLIIAQDFSTGKLIRFLNNNDSGKLAEFCCQYNEKNAREIERLFEQSFGYHFADYPHKEINSPQQQ
jgi:hypothetical protein